MYYQHTADNVRLNALITSSLHRKLTQSGLKLYLLLGYNMAAATMLIQ